MPAGGFKVGAPPPGFIPTPPFVGMPAGLTTDVIGGLPIGGLGVPGITGGLPIGGLGVPGITGGFTTGVLGVVNLLTALLTSAAVPAATAAFFNVLVKLLDGFVAGLVGITAGFFAVVTGFVVVVLAATGAFVVLAATGALVVVLAATGGFAAGVVFAATAGFLIAEVIAGLGLACGALLVPVCTRETGAPAVVPREVGVATPSDTGARPEIVSRGARETDVRLPKSS